MKRFIIQCNEYLKQEIQGFYHEDYHGGGKWKTPGTIENIITTLKNDITPFPNDVLISTANSLRTILIEDLPQILHIRGLNNLSVCTIPRAKVSYQQNQLLFKATISNVANQLTGFVDSTDFIIRHTDTRTTHRDKAGYGGNGDLPYPEITNNTCHISDEVIGKDILLIDDLYTKTINIDEDAIQALLNKGAKSVIFYAVGRTVNKGEF
jgi:hypothetical protein